MSQDLRELPPRPECLSQPAVDHLPEVSGPALSVDRPISTARSTSARRPACRSFARSGCTIRTTRRPSLEATNTSGGRDILVVPVTEKGSDVAKCLPPCGTWYDFWTEERIEGGREINRTVDLSTLPLYVRAGAILPMGRFSNIPVKKPTARLASAFTRGQTVRSRSTKMTASPSLIVTEIGWASR